MTDYAAIDRYIDDHLNESLDELARLCAVPSISAQGTGIRECAELVADMLRRRGFQAEVMPTKGNPVVYAEMGGQSDKTMLFYNHYDVQPPEPLELWTSPPFEATIRDGMMVARGVSDDKGHIQVRLAALDALKAVTGRYPCRVKFVVEGEEEVSSVSLPDFVRANAKKLAADGCVWEFGGVDVNGRPVQYLGMRGICYVELRAKTADVDAHSGLGGSIFPNAAWRLVWALNTLKGPDERIRIPGHYDNVVPATARDLELIAAIPDESLDMLERYGLKLGYLKGLTGGPELRRAEIFEPTCTICGLTAGYQGPGSKTVLPAEARAKVDFRLVPNQTPEEILEKLRRHLDAEGFSDIEVAFLGGEAPGRTDLDDPLAKIAADTSREVYGKEPVIMPMVGGSGPNHVFLEALHVPVVTSGLGYPGTRAHAPDENIVIDQFVLAARHTARILERFGQG